MKIGIYQTWEVSFIFSILDKNDLMGICNLFLKSWHRVSAILPADIRCMGKLLFHCLGRQRLTVTAAHAGNIFHHLFTGLDVVLSRDGDLLHDGRSAAVVIAYIVNAASR